jgi:hypothetical protein
MKADFTSSTFDPGRGFLRVLMQQGRVQLDADWNEQVAILLHYLQALAVDVIGPYGGPASDLGFQIDPQINDGKITDIAIGSGNYYVRGILCENDPGTETDLTYFNQAYYPVNPTGDKSLTDLPILVYLDVWERHLTAVEVPSIREVALGGPDTATRSQVVWQVRALHAMGIEKEFNDLKAQVEQLEGELKKAALDKEAQVGKKAAAEAHEDPKGVADAEAAIESDETAINNLTDRISSDKGKLENWRDSVDWGLQLQNRLGVGTRAALRARARPAPSKTDPCIISPDSRYRGIENQLYRVEIHRGSPAPQDPNAEGSALATFKWSRENGSVLFPIRTLNGDIAIVEHLGRDQKGGLEVDDWVEIVDDDIELLNRPGLLAQVMSVDTLDMSVTLNFGAATQKPSYDETSRKHPLLRRWDQHKGDPNRGGTQLDAGAAIVRERTEQNHNWVELEDGVEIQFLPIENRIYRTGDYWLIPARVAIGDVVWPREGEVGEPLSKPPDGIIHSYAPLALIFAGPDGKMRLLDLRRKIGVLTEWATKLASELA